MRRSLDDVAVTSSSSPPHHRRGEDYDEEVAASLLEGRIVLRFSSSPTFGKDKGHRHLWPLVKNVMKKPSHHLAVRGRCPPEVLPLSLSSTFSLAAARLIPPGSGRRRSKSTVTDLF
ncbi:hypothetical protein B296_00027192 [Ensete ventricosum]|uniref:Uncharacterized protein n=1 Tax=Ensete ventricosum TaxID=4639 RepID=A0A426XKJ7_ENSVE|nr:hypothetical protein B296_00027192 [Ensete ventricosum]